MNNSRVKLKSGEKPWKRTTKKRVKKGHWEVHPSSLLVVVLLLLLSPVLVELVDFDGCVALLKQVKSLQVPQKNNTF